MYQLHTHAGVINKINDRKSKLYCLKLNKYHLFSCHHNNNKTHVELEKVTKQILQKPNAFQLIKLFIYLCMTKEPLFMFLEMFSLQKSIYLFLCQSILLMHNFSSRNVKWVSVIKLINELMLTYSNINFLLRKVSINKAFYLNKINFSLTHFFLYYFQLN